MLCLSQCLKIRVKKLVCLQTGTPEYGYYFGLCFRLAIGSVRRAGRKEGFHTTIASAFHTNPYTVIIIAIATTCVACITAIGARLAVVTATGVAGSTGAGYGTGILTIGRVAGNIATTFYMMSCRNKALYTQSLQIQF